MEDTNLAPISKIADRYQILEEVGSGGMGKVFKVLDEHIQRVVALKILKNTGNIEPRERQRFLREVQATAALKHPNIVNVYDVSTWRGQPFFTMDYISGVPLKDKISELPMRELVKMIIDVAKCLDYAHQKGIIHRDIKPSNIIISTEGEIKVVDFGLAKLLHDHQKISITGHIMGTLQYMPPEQLQGKSADARSDIYSLGATLYEVLTGIPPFNGESQMNLMFQALQKKPEPPSKIKKVPEDIELLCLQTLEKDPEKRPQSALELAYGLEKALGNRSAIRKSRRRRSTAPSSQNNRKMATFAGLITVATIFLLWGLYGTNDLLSDGMKPLITEREKNAGQILKQEKDAELKKQVQHHFAKYQEFHRKHMLLDAWLELKQAIKLDPQPVLYVYAMLLYYSTVDAICFNKPQKTSKKEDETQKMDEYFRLHFDQISQKEDKDSVLALGLLHHFGLGVTKNHEKSLVILQRAADLGALDALRILCYHDKKNPKILELAKKNNYAPVFYQKGHSAKEADKQEFLQKAYDLGHVEAACILGYFLELELQQKQENLFLQQKQQTLVKIIRLYSFAAENNLPRGMSALRDLHLRFGSSQPFDVSIPGNPSFWQQKFEKALDILEEQRPSDLLQNAKNEARENK